MDPKFKVGEKISVEDRVTTGTGKKLFYPGTILSLDMPDYKKNGTVAMYYYQVQYISPNGTPLINIFPEIKLHSAATGGRRRRNHKTKRVCRSRRSRSRSRKN